jgi:hypothetical protein
LATAVKFALGDEMLSEIKDHEPKTLRVAFVARCASLSAYIASGKRWSPLELAKAYLTEGSDQIFRIDRPPSPGKPHSEPNPDDPQG